MRDTVIVRLDSKAHPMMKDKLLSNPAKKPIPETLLPKLKPNPEAVTTTSLLLPSQLLRTTVTSTLSASRIPIRSVNVSSAFGTSS